MKHRFLFTTLLFSFLARAIAELPPAEKLLPNDTLVLLTTPEVTKFCDAFKTLPQSRLWNDVAMKPFREKFTSKFKADLVVPLEKELGIKFSDYQNLAQGQFTFALTQNGWQGKTNESPGWIFLLDTKDKSSILKTNLTRLKEKWVESGKQIKAEKIRDLEFTTLITSTDVLADLLGKILPSGTGESDEPKPPGRKLEITIGQSGSLLLVGNALNVIEKVLAHQSGGLAPSLAEEAAYAANHNSMLRDAPFYFWVNVKPLVEIFTRQAANKPSDNPLAPKPEKLVASTGIGNLKTIAFSYRIADAGTAMQLSLGVPEANRQGLFKMLVAESKEASPPTFVPADATKFIRWRLNLPKAWTGLEEMLTDISPAVGGAFKLIFESAGKDKDPNYDLKKELLANLGDDLINYERKSAAGALTDLASPPSIYLLGSATPDKLASAFKVGMTLLSPTPLEEREFLGRKIYKMPPSPLLSNDPKKPGRNLNFSASGGYLAFSSDVAMLEEFLRSSDTKAKALSEITGFKEAAEKVGGTGAGLFGYHNRTEEMRATFTALKNQSVTLADLLKNPAIAAKTPAEVKKINEWADFSLLPSYDNVSKYFYYSVYGGAFNANGFTMKFFYPTPPQLKK